MAKKNSLKHARERDRRAIAEQLRKEQQQRERRRSLLILGGAVVVVVGLLLAALIPYLKQVREDRRIASVALSDLGSASSAAGCEPVQQKAAHGNNEHVLPPKKITYKDAPPASGPHWGNFLQGPEIRNFYSPKDRPQVERLVHSLEHGHTILWYDATVKPGTKAYSDIKAMAEKLGEGSYFMSAPWLPTDGGSFPDGKHVALTHWTGPQDQKAVTQYCAKPSGEAVAKFMKDYDKMNAPEPGAA